MMTERGLLPALLSSPQHCGVVAATPLAAAAAGSSRPHLLRSALLVLSATLCGTSFPPAAASPCHAAESESLQWQGQTTARRTDTRLGASPSAPQWPARGPAGTSLRRTGAASQPAAEAHPHRAATRRGEAGEPPSAGFRAAAARRRTHDVMVVERQGRELPDGEPRRLRGVVGADGARGGLGEAGKRDGDGPGGRRREERWRAGQGEFRSAGRAEGRGGGDSPSRTTRGGRGLGSRRPPPAGRQRPARVVRGDGPAGRTTGRAAGTGRGRGKRASRSCAPLMPVSSSSSRSAAFGRGSSSSTKPPGSAHEPCGGARGAVRSGWVELRACGGAREMARARAAKGSLRRLMRRIFGGSAAVATETTCAGANGAEPGRTDWFEEGRLAGPSRTAASTVTAGRGHWYVYLHACAGRERGAINQSCGPRSSAWPGQTVALCACVL